jgi:hypothetical protein
MKWLIDLGRVLEVSMDELMIGKTERDDPSLEPEARLTHSAPT